MKQRPRMFFVLVFGLCSLTATGEMKFDTLSEECHRIEFFVRQHWSAEWDEETLHDGISQSMRNNWGRLIGQIDLIERDPETRKEIWERTIVLWGAGSAGELKVEWGGRPWQEKVKNKSAGRVARMLGKTFPEARVLQSHSEEYAYVEFPPGESLDFDATGVHGLGVEWRHRFNSANRKFALLDCALGARPYAERAQGGIDLVFVDGLGAEGYGGYRRVMKKMKSSFMNVVCLPDVSDWMVAHEIGHPLLNGGDGVHRKKATVMCIPKDGLVCSGIDDKQFKRALRKSGRGRTPRLLLPCGERAQDVGQGAAVTATSPSPGQSLTPPAPPPLPPFAPPPATHSPPQPPRR